MEQPMRILQVFAQMNRGGAETMIMNLYRNIDRTKIQFDFIVHTQEAGVFDKEIRDLGGEIHYIPKYNGKNHFFYKNSWKKLFNDNPQYKVVHSHVRSTAALYLKIAKNYGLFTIAHSHNTSSGNNFSAGIKNIYQYPIRYIADYFFACSNEAGRWLFGKKIIKNSNFRLLKNAIEVNDFVYNSEIRNKKRKELNIEDKIVIGHVGRFHPQKNHDFLISLFKKIYFINSDAVLLLVGDGELRKSVEARVVKEGISDRVIFTGVRSDINQVFQAMDVFVFPSLYEGLGIVVIEAQSTGLHCVVSDTIPEEAHVSKLVSSIPLEAEEDIWINQLLKYTQGYERENMYSQISLAGYNIKETSRWLENFYLESI